MKALLSSVACLALTTALFTACGSDKDGDKDGNSVSGSGATGNGTGSTGNGSGSGGTGVIIPGTGGGIGIGTGSTGAGSGEVCDGQDNDGDGIVDNVDVGGDGICDCLNIGTIGAIGPWSNGGNIFKEWLDTRSPIPAKEIGDAPLDAATLAGLDVIVVLRVDTAELTGDGGTTPAHHQFTDAEVSALDAWVRAGGGLLTTIGYQGDEAAEIQNVNRLLDPFGLGYSSNSGDVNGYLEDWVTHPISEGVQRVYTENGVAPDDTNGTVIARGPNNVVALVADEIDSGRAIVFGDEWITYDSEWADVEDQQIALLWLNMIKWLTPPARCQVPIPDIIK